MKSSPKPTLLVPALVALAFALAACGGGGSGPTAPPAPTPPTAVVASVEFVYQAPTDIDPTVRQQFLTCVNAVGLTHIHPSWLTFNRIFMINAGANRWEITFNDVPVGSEQAIRISDPNTCSTDPNGASTTNVFANGVLLTQVVDTPGNGIEPGLAFTVATGGAVTP